MADFHRHVKLPEGTFAWPFRIRAFAVKARSSSSIMFASGKDCAHVLGPKVLETSDSRKATANQCWERCARGETKHVLLVKMKGPVWIGLVYQVYHLSSLPVALLAVSGTFFFINQPMGKKDIDQSYSHDISMTFPMISVVSVTFP